MGNEVKYGVPVLSAVGIALEFLTPVIPDEIALAFIVGILAYFRSDNDLVKYGVPVLAVIAILLEFVSFLLPDEVLVFGAVALVTFFLEE